MWRQGHRARRESSCRRRRSIAIPFARDQFRPAYLQGFTAVDFFQARQEIGAPGGNRRPGGDQPGDDSLALGDLNLFAFAEEIFDLPKPVAQVAHGSFSHVIHFSITLAKAQSSLDARPHRLRTTRGAAAVPDSAIAWFSRLVSIPIWDCSQDAGRPLSDGETTVLGGAQ